MSMPSTDTTDERLPVEAGERGAPLVGQVQESVDPFDYAETIVRDLAVHVGSRLRDFRSDLAAMHSAVVQLPETMKINALGHSIQELRERLAHLTGVVSQQVTRYPEELDRVAKTAADLLNRVAGLESWIAAARQSMAQGDAPNLPMPTGGFVGQDQMNAIIGQVHESLMRVVGAVRDLQLDVRDIRTDLRSLSVDQAVAAAATPPAAGTGEGGTADAAPAEPAAPVAPPGPDLSGALAALETRLSVLEGRPAPVAAAAPDLSGALAALETRLSTLEGRPVPAPAPVMADPAPALADLSRRLMALEARPVAAPAPVAPALPATAAADGLGDVAALVFGSWSRLAQPSSDAALSQTVEAVLSTLSRRFDETVRTPTVTKGSGIVAVATHAKGATPIVALLATEDLCGRTWTLGAGGAEMRAAADGDKPAATRTPCWRALLAAAALVEQQQAGTRVLPLLVYGHGSIDSLPSRDDMASYGQRLGVSAAADRLLVVGAADQSHPGLARPADLIAALADLGVSVPA